MKSSRKLKRKLNLKNDHDLYKEIQYMATHLPETTIRLHKLQDEYVQDKAEDIVIDEFLHPYLGLYDAWDTEFKSGQYKGITGKLLKFKLPSNKDADDTKISVYLKLINSYEIYPVSRSFYVFTPDVHYTKAVEYLIDNRDKTIDAPNAWRYTRSLYEYLQGRNIIRDMNQSALDPAYNEEEQDFYEVGEITLTQENIEHSCSVVGYKNEIHKNSLYYNEPVSIFINECLGFSGSTKHNIYLLGDGLLKKMSKKKLSSFVVQSNNGLSRMSYDGSKTYIKTDALWAVIPDKRKEALLKLLNYLKVGYSESCTTEITKGFNVSSIKIEGLTFNHSKADKFIKRIDHDFRRIDELSSMNNPVYMTEDFGEGNFDSGAIIMLKTVMPDSSLPQNRTAEEFLQVLKNKKQKVKNGNTENSEIPKGS